MSIQNLDPEFIKHHLKNKQSFHEDHTLKLLSEPVKSLEGRSGTYHIASLECLDLGMWNILLGDFKSAQDSFYKAIEFQKKWLEMRGKGNVYNIYVSSLQCLQASILTLDKGLIKTTAAELALDLDVPLNVWPSGTKPWYALVKALVGLILGWDQNKMNEIKSEEIRLNNRTQGALGVIWAILDNNLEDFKISYQKLLNSERQEARNRPDLPEKYLSLLGMELVILSKMRGCDLKDFDPPMVSLNYIQQVKV